jgi:hypothetical protein
LAARLKAAQDTQRALDEAEREVHLLEAEQDYLQSLLLLKQDEGMVQLVRAASLTARQSLLMLTRLPSADGFNSPASTESSDGQQQQQQQHQQQQLSPVPEASSSTDLGALAPAPLSSAELATASTSIDN